MPTAGDRVVAYIRTAKFRARFYSRVIDGPKGCHIWTGAVSSNGRGMVGVFRETYSVHRIAWMIQHGRTIPADLTVDHLCYVGLCVNPDHLEVVDMTVNRQRAVEHFGYGGSLRVRHSRVTGEPAFQVLWTDYAPDGSKKQRGRTFATREQANAFMVEIRNRPVT